MIHQSWLAGWLFSHISQHKLTHWTLHKLTNPLFHVCYVCLIGHDGIRWETWPKDVFLRDELFGDLCALWRTATFVQMAGVSIWCLTKKKNLKDTINLIHFVPFSVALASPKGHKVNRKQILLGHFLTQFSMNLIFFGSSSKWWSWCHFRIRKFATLLFVSLQI